MLNDVPPSSTSSQNKPLLEESAVMKTLSEHRIAKIETRKLRDRYPRFVGRGARGNPSGRGGSRQIRIVTTDKSAEGWAMSWLSEEKVQAFIGVCLSDLFDPEHGLPDLCRGVDRPLYDLIGHILGVPVYALFGAKGPKATPIYSSSIHFEDIETEQKPGGIATLLSDCQQDYDAGYRAFKLKIGRGFQAMPCEEGIRRDVEVTRAVRQRFPDCEILVDANDGYTCEDFLGYVTAVSDCDLYWIEEPFFENRDDLLKLREHMDKVGCRALIVEREGRTEGGEWLWRYGDYSQRHVDRLFALARENLVDVFNMDLDLVGFTRWRRVMPELVEANVLASPHTWAGTLRPCYTAQLAAGVGNVVMIEGIPGQVEGSDYSAYKFVDGKLVVPEDLGFGLPLITE